MLTCTRGTLAAGLVIVLSACSGGGGGSTSTTSPTSSIPVSVAKQSGDAQTATVGATIAAPVVKVLNFSGGGVGGVAVTFSATSGDVLGATSVTTGSDGTASAGSWKLSTVSGTHTVSATATGVALAASFTATVNADVAKTMSKSAGDNQTGFTGANVGIAPAVLIADQYGNAVSGTPVTYAVATGGGSVANPAATSNANGIAAVGSWRLGAAAGANSLVATATGLTSVTFNATSVIDPCDTFVPVVAGQSVSGTLTANDCLFAGDYFADLYSFTLAAGEFMQLDMASTAFDPWIDLGSAVNDDYYGFDSNSGGGTSSRIRVLAPPGQYLAIANSFAERVTGAYTFGATAWTGSVGTCESDVWMVPSATAYAQTVAATDCSITATAGNVFADGIFFWAEAGRTYTFTSASTAIDPTLTLRSLNASNQVVTIATDDNSGGGTTARITWTPAQTTLGIIFAAAAAVGSTGAYSLTFTSAGASAAMNGPAILPLGRARAARRLASGGAGALSAFLPGPARTAVQAPRRP